jgi:hypothetical protein
LPQLGELDREKGEFWVNNPFLMPKLGENLSAYERNRLFLNHEGTSFIDASFASAVDLDSDSRSVMAGDFNGDGYPDLLVASVGGGPVRLFLNRFPATMNFAVLDLLGAKSNRSAIGSRVIAECGGKRIVRDLFPANGFMGQGPAELHLGVGTVQQIDRLTIRWPSGDEQIFENLPVGGRLRTIEGDSRYTFVEMSRTIID